MSNPVLKVKNYSVDFWVDGVWYPAAIDMNFELEAGKVLAIVGESGSGKSTTALGLMNLLASNARMSGSILVKGNEMLNASPQTMHKYRGKEGALEASVLRVIKGSTGVWGKVPMIPHSHHTIDEIREMVGGKNREPVTRIPAS